MRSPVILPDLGAARATLSVWFVEPGDIVYAGDRLVEVTVAGASFDVTSPVTGKFAECCARPDQPLLPGQTLGIVDECPV